MNPIPIAAYLDARSKAREKRDEQLRAMSMQGLQQQMALAQQGYELRDRQHERSRQSIADAQAKELHDLNVAAARRAAAEEPTKARTAFLLPMIEPYSQYRAAVTAYNDYMKPGAVKVRLPSEQRGLADNIRKTRASAMAAREAIARLGQASGHAGVDLASLESEFPIDPLPVLGGVQFSNGTGVMSGNNPVLKLPVRNSWDDSSAGTNTGTLQLKSPYANVGSTKPLLSSVDTSGFTLPTNKKGQPLPPAPPPPSAPPPPTSSATDAPVSAPPMPSQQGKDTFVTDAAAKTVGPPMQIKPFKQTLMEFKSFLQPIKASEDNIEYSDFYGPQQEGIDKIAVEMFQDAMDTFIPRAWNRLGTARQHAETNAADFTEHGLNPENVAGILARHVHGDAMYMKSVILERYASLFNQFTLPLKVTERLMKDTKDRLELDKEAQAMYHARRNEARISAEAQREAEKHPLAVRELKVKTEIAEKTKQAVIDKAKADLANAQKETIKIQKQIEAAERAEKQGKTIVWSKILGDAVKSWNGLVDGNISKTIELAKTILTGRRNTQVQETGSATEIDAALNKLARLQGMLTGPTGEYLTAFKNNSPQLSVIAQNRKKALYDVVKSDPQLKDFFTELAGTFANGGPAGKQ